MRFYDLRSLCKTLVDNNQCLKKKKSRTVKEEEKKKNNKQKKKHPTEMPEGSSLLPIPGALTEKCLWRQMLVADSSWNRRLVYLKTFLLSQHLIDLNFPCAKPWAKSGKAKQKPQPSPSPL